MSRRGNCHDNAVAESFFNLLKRERIRRKTYRNRGDARRDVFDYIEMIIRPLIGADWLKTLQYQTPAEKFAECVASIS